MKILVSGSSGLVGGALVRSLEAGGHSVTRLVRGGAAGGGTARWDPALGTIDREPLEGLDAAVHLAGENIASGRWTARRKKAIHDSRTRGTHLLCEALANLSRAPRVVVCASAIGFYGDRGDEPLDECSGAGAGFLVDVCRDWEQAAQPARERGIRVVHVRFGMVLSAAGGALAKMLLPFKLGLGGIVGSGRQWWSWIDLDDAVGAVVHALSCEELSGPVNGVSPDALTNRDFTKTLGRVLRRPTKFPVPAFAARLLLGQMADELLLASARVVPRRLEETGYAFQFRTLESSLRHALAR